MGCPLRIIVLVKGYWQGGRSPIRKAQNDVRLASNVGHGVAADTPDANLVLTATEGVRRPS